MPTHSIWINARLSVVKRRKTLRIAVVHAAVALLFAMSAAAQEPPEAERGARIVGGSIGMPINQGRLNSELFTIGVHWTQADAGRLGADLSLGTIPRTLSEGFVSVGVRAGVTVPLALTERVLLLPTSGVSLLGGFGPGGGGGTAGFNVGAAAVLGKAGPGVPRIGATWHRIGGGGGGGVWLWEFGFVGRRPSR